MSEDRDKKFSEDVERARRLQSDRLFQLKCQYGDILGQKLFEHEQTKVRVEESLQKLNPKVEVSFTELENVRKKVQNAEANIKKFFDEANAIVEEELASCNKELAVEKAKKLAEIKRLENNANKEIEEAKAKAQKEIDLAKEKLQNKITLIESQLNAFSSEARKLLAEITEGIAFCEPNKLLFVFGKKLGSEWQFQFGKFEPEMPFSDFAKQLHELMSKRSD